VELVVVLDDVLVVLEVLELVLVVTLLLVDVVTVELVLLEVELLDEVEVVTDEDVDEVVTIVVELEVLLVLDVVVDEVVLDDVLLDVVVPFTGSHASPMPSRSVSCWPEFATDGQWSSPSRTVSSSRSMPIRGPDPGGTAV
jgi:hypothetical protein